MAAHPASAPDELLSVLLELRAHVDAIGAQASRVLTQVERLDARVAALERRSARGATAAAPRARARPRCSSSRRTC
jgi:hypothetical protein